MDIKGILKTGTNPWLLGILGGIVGYKQFSKTRGLVLPLLGGSAVGFLAGKLIQKQFFAEAAVAAVTPTAQLPATTQQETDIFDLYPDVPEQVAVPTIKASTPSVNEQDEVDDTSYASNPGYNYNVNDLYDEADTETA